MYYLKDLHTHTQTDRHTHTHTDVKQERLEKVAAVSVFLRELIGLA